MGQETITEKRWADLCAADNTRVICDFDNPVFQVYMLVDEVTNNTIAMKIDGQGFFEIVEAENV